MYRTKLVKQFMKRLHIITGDLKLVTKPKFESASVPVYKGIELISLRWNIPSAINEEGPWGGALLYNQVQILNIGKVGYLPRLGLGLI
ncbi:hypothetical protein [Bacillus thuringiensis]|uniref:hypothetical protein n=1 Tax=Bacillus thuringiensis TaxID=1428 RepID=UPI0015D50B78|nr:hypothetical protein [Bacillus thuringiensis]